MINTPAKDPAVPPSAGPTPSSADKRALLVDEAGRLYVDSAYSGAGHLNEAARWRKWDNWLGIPAAVLTAVFAFSATVFSLSGSSTWLTALAAGLAGGLAAAKGYLRTDDLAEGHARQGNKFLSMRNEARIFIHVHCHSDESFSQLQFRLEQLRGRYNDILQDPPPRVSKGSYQKAKEGIAAGEMNYVDDPLWQELFNAQNG